MRCSGSLRKRVDHADTVSLLPAVLEVKCAMAGAKHSRWEPCAKTTTWDPFEPHVVDQRTYSARCRTKVSLPRVIRFRNTGLVASRRLVLPRLTPGAERGGSRIPHAGLQQLGATGAGQAGPAVATQVILVVALAALEGSIVAQCRTAVVHAALENVDNRFVQSCGFGPGHGASGRVDPCLPQCFVGIDVSNAGDW